MLFLSLAAALVCGFTGPGPTKGQGSLTYREFGDFGKDPFLLGTMGYGSPTPVVPTGYSKPKGVIDPAFVSLQMGRGGQAYICLIGKTKVDESPDLVWVDWNRDRIFADDEKAVKADSPSVPGSRVFKPVKDPVLDGKPVKFALAMAEPGSISVVPAGYLEAMVELDGKVVKVGVVDTSANGVYGDPFGAKSTGDILLFDRNGDGVFDIKSPSSPGGIFKGELLPLLPVMSIGGSALYEITVKDGATIHFDPYTGPTGEVQFDGAKGSLLLVNGPKGLLFADPMTGANRLPVGTYEMVGSEYELADGEKTWKVSFSAGEANKVQVAEDKPLQIKCGPPFSMSVSDVAAGAKHQFSLTIKDRSGIAIQGMAGPKGERPAPPEMVIADAKGKVVHKLVFSYG